MLISHTLRTSAATRLYLRTHDLLATARALNHVKSDITQQHYIDTDEPAVVDAYQKALPTSRGPALRIAGKPDDWVSAPSADSPQPSGQGAERTRTAVRGFAGLCLTTRPRRQAAHRSRPPAELQ